MRSLKLHATPPPKLSATPSGAAELPAAESYEATGVGNGPAHLETTGQSEQAAATASADGFSGTDGGGGHGTPPPQPPPPPTMTTATATAKPNSTASSATSAGNTQQAALSKVHGDVEGRSGRDSGQAFGTRTSAVQIGRSRRPNSSSPSQPSSLESVSPSFSLSSSASSSSSSSSPSSSSSSALSSSSSTDMANSANGTNGINNKQLALNGSGGLASNSSSSSSSGNSSSGSGHGGGGGSHSSSSSSSGSSNMTAFLSKLWRMVNDSHNDDQIRWSQSGCSFVIINQIQFAKDMLPIYFKHSNMASFIRQLNMYGFRKIPLMSANKSGDQRADVAQFYHVNFMRGQEQRLSSIKRKSNSSRTQNLVVNGSFCDEVRAILRDVKSIRDGQNSSESILGALQLDNKSLWRDVSILRSQHHKQRRVIEKLIQFLLSLIQNRNQLVRKRRMKFMISPENLTAAAAAADGTASSNGGGGSGSETGDILFNLTANQADEGLFQMGEIMDNTSDQHASNNLNHNHHHHHHHPYYNFHQATPTASGSNPDHEHGMEVDANDEHQASCTNPPAATFANGKEEPTDVHVMHPQQQQQGQLIMADSMAQAVSRRASTVSMASVATSNRHQLFEMGAAASPAGSLIGASSSPSVRMYDNRPSSGPLMTGTANSRRAEGSNSVEDNDELMPNGATAASMMLASSAQQYLSTTSGRPAPNTAKSHNHGVDNNGHSRQQVMSKLSQLGQENRIKVKGAQSLSSGPQQQLQQPLHHHHNQHHHQLQLRHNQQQQMQHLADAQQSDQQSTARDDMNNHGSRQFLANSSNNNSICYSNVPMLARANGIGPSQHQHTFNNNSANSNSNNQQQLFMANSHFQQQIHSSHHILQQQQQQHQQQQQQHHQLAHYSSRSGAGQSGPEQRQQHSINGLLASRRHHYNQSSHQQHNQLQARPSSCHQQLSQWTATSIYNTMAQPDLVSMTGGGGNGGGRGAFANGFSNMGGVFSELRVRPSFLSALGAERPGIGTSSPAATSTASGSNTNEISSGEGGVGNSSSGGHNVLNIPVNANSANNNNQIDGRLSTASSNNSQTYY